MMTYYMTPDRLVLRRIDTSGKVEIYWMSATEWRKSCADTPFLRKTHVKVSEGEAMEYIARVIASHKD